MDQADDQPQATSYDAAAADDGITLLGALAPVLPADDEAALVARVRDGDPVAFTTLFRRYVRELHAFASTYVRSPDAAEDVVQDVFVRTWENRATWTVRTTVAQYLYGAVRNRALHVIEHVHATARRDDRLAAAAVSASPATGTARVEEEELRHRLARAIDTLPARCREVFVLSRAKRLSQREIAETLGIALPTVKAHLARAFRALEEAREEHERGR